MEEKIFIVDSHCHLDYLTDMTIDEIRRMANQHQVSHFLTISVEEKQWDLLTDIASAGDIDCAVGIHPCDVANAAKGWEDRLLGVARRDAVVAIGETGLDNYHNPNQKQMQLEALEAHAYVAKTVSKPIVIHMRDATPGVMDFLSRQKIESGIIHCFSEDYSIAKKMIDMGLMISLSGIVTFKNAHLLHEVAKKIPLESLLLETDSPFLAPVPYRGKTNYPAYTRYVAEAIAELRGITWEEVAQQTTHNYFRLTKRSLNNQQP